MDRHLPHLHRPFQRRSYGHDPVNLHLPGCTYAMVLMDQRIPMLALKLLQRSSRARARLL